jgi:hypothetical protein
VGDEPHAEVQIVGWKRTRMDGLHPNGEPITFFVTAIVASNPGDFGQGRVWCSNTGASRYDSIQKGALERDFMPLAQVVLSITDQNEHVNTQKVASYTDCS